ncbi:MAG: DUF2628 domain-containing protein [Clostridia bacterium]|nr:DUF2628 domain-containing protein [Clostridia bacterium]
MTLKKQNDSCALCHAYLFEEDDVVYCPVCGAPHHRECYNSIGHCALEETHGTDMQYDKLKAAEKADNSKVQYTQSTIKDDNYTPGDEIFRNLPPMDFLGGVAPDEIIEDGVTAKEARNFVISNTARYIPKFKRLSNEQKKSWNLMAFFFPSQWLLSRKMYKAGIICAVLTIIFNLLTFPLQITLFNLGFGDIKTTAEMMQFLTANLSQIHFTLLISAFLSSSLDVLLRLLVAIFGDWWYKQHAISKIKDIKANSDDIAEDFRKQGGVNILLFLIGLLATNYLPSIIFTLFWG